MAASTISRQSSRASSTRSKATMSKLSAQRAEQETHFLLQQQLAESKLREEEHKQILDIHHRLEAIERKRKDRQAQRLLLARHQVGKDLPLKQLTEEDGEPHHAPSAQFKLVRPSDVQPVSSAGQSLSQLAMVHSAAANRRLDPPSPSTFGQTTSTSRSGPAVRPEQPHLSSTTLNTAGVLVSTHPSGHLIQRIPQPPPVSLIGPAGFHPPQPASHPGSAGFLQPPPVPSCTGRLSATASSDPFWSEWTSSTSSFSEPNWAGRLSSAASDESSWLSTITAASDFFRS